MLSLDNLVGLIAPHRCVGCKRESNTICEYCTKQLVRPISRCFNCQRVTDNFLTCKTCRRVSHLYAVVAGSRYEGLSEDVIKKMKFGFARSSARDIARLLVPLIPKEKRLLVTYLPTANKRVRQRGFDQSQLIAKSLSKFSGLPYQSLLVRESDVRQVGATKKARLENASKMFSCRFGAKIAGATILVVDDVITTGASLNATASVLKSAGAKRVYGLVFAQA